MRHIVVKSSSGSPHAFHADPVKLAIVASHPIQYYTPIFRALAARCDIHVYYGQRLTPQQQAAAGFGTAFDWDIDLLSDYPSTFLQNVSRNPGTDCFGGCDTPEIGARLRGGGFDALLIIGWHLKSYIQALLSAKRCGIPILVRGDSHLETPRSALKRNVKELVHPMFLRLFDGALYVGQKSREFYEHYHYPAHRLFHSPHCVDNAWFAARATLDARACLRRSRDICDDAFVVLFAGKLVPFKRPLDVVAAAAHCRANGRNVHVMVAGSGELEHQMRHRAAERGVPVHMLGFCNQTQMPSAYAAADALMLPSNGEETWGLVANEALACDRPVIVSEACGCAPDLAGDSTAGRVVPLSDIGALADAIAGLMDEPPLVSSIRARADRCSVARAAQGVLDGAEAVRRVAREKRSRRAR
jgi:glycosyltransferase involved in cell wall biosynthesis